MKASKATLHRRAEACFSPLSVKQGAACFTGVLASAAPGETVSLGSRGLEGTDKEGDVLPA